MNWSVEQRRLLSALGHDLMVHGQPWPVAAKPQAGEAKAAPTKPTVRGQEASAPAAAPPPGARLLEALRRAAGGAEVAALVDDFERLRREPALKRALWPRLRALRRSH